MEQPSTTMDVTKPSPLSNDLSHDCIDESADKRAGSFITPEDRERTIAAAVATILGTIGEDPSREGLRDTPMSITDALFANACDGLVAVKDIHISSLCEHHVLPFFGKVHIGYIPKRKVLGLSKFSRIVEIYSKRLQIQERLVGEIAAAVRRVTESKDVIVSMDAIHMCMKARGVRESEATTITTCGLGCFEDEPAKREEFYRLTRS